MTEGGVGRYGRDLAAGLRGLDDGPEVSVAGPLSPRLASAPFTPWGRVATGLRLRGARADVVHALHVDVPWNVGAAKVVTIPDLIPLEVPGAMPSAARRRLYRRTVHVAARRAGLVIVPSELTRTSLERFGVPASRIRKIPWGVADFFRPPSENERHAARARFAGGSAYVAAVASSRPHKNLAALALAARAIRARSELDVVCVGERVPRDLALRLAGPLADPDLRAFYGGAEVLVLPSLMEGFGYPVLESLACGVPVVCGRGVGALEYVRDAAVVVDVRDASEIADAAIDVASDASRRGDLAAAGLARARVMSIEAMARATHEVYGELVPNGH